MSDILKMAERYRNSLISAHNNVEQLAQDISETILEAYRNHSAPMSFRNFYPNYSDLLGPPIRVIKPPVLGHAEINNGVAPPLGSTWEEFNSFRINSPWGIPRSYVIDGLIRTDIHAGIDYRANVGTRVNSVLDEIVIEVKFTNVFGNQIRIQHPHGYHSLYAHLSNMYVTQRQRVVAGQHIANSGNTGDSTGPHLHFGWDGNADGVFSHIDPADDPFDLFSRVYNIH